MLCDTLICVSVTTWLKGCVERLESLSVALFDLCARLKCHYPLVKLHWSYVSGRVCVEDRVLL